MGFATYNLGIAAFIREFAEPRVHDGVWDHIDFCRNPRGRAQRTGLALMLGMRLTL